MARPRKLDPNLILDATERVVADRGAANLTLDTVAHAASVSKASVLYDYGTKQALIAAVIARALARDNAFNEEMMTRSMAAEHRVILGRIAAAKSVVPSAETGPALHLIAALAQDADLRILMQENQAKILQLIADDSPGRRGPLLAYLALEGLKFLEHLDFVRWSPAERQQLLEEISWLVYQEPTNEAGSI